MTTWFDPFRYLLSTLFGVRWVLLIDFDGERNVRMMRHRRYRRWYARRIGCGIRDVFLLDGGDIDGGEIGNRCYVTRWEPYAPFSHKLTGARRPAYPRLP